MNKKPPYSQRRKKPPQRWQIMSFIIVVAFLFDQITKIFIKTSLGAGQTIPIIGDFFILKYVLNNGVAFGVFSGNVFFTYIIPIIMIGIFFYLIYKYYHEPFYAYAFTFMIAGTIGNLFDRFGNKGYVIDFLTFNFFGYRFPSFNFADIFLVLSIFSIFIRAILVSWREKNDK